VDLTWSPNAERDLEGYRVFRVPATGNDADAVVVCQLTVMTSCQDASPPPPEDGDLEYYVVAVDLHPDTGLERQGDASSPRALVGGAKPAPNAPVGLTATFVDSDIKLTWSLPDPEHETGGESCDPDFPEGREICHFNIYRDGNLFADRLDLTVTGDELEWTDTDTGGVSHTYYVTSVNRYLVESRVMAGPVSP